MALFSFRGPRLRPQITIRIAMATPETLIRCQADWALKYFCWIRLEKCRNSPCLWDSRASRLSRPASRKASQIYSGSSHRSSLSSFGLTFHTSLLHWVLSLKLGCCLHSNSETHPWQAAFIFLTLSKDHLFHGIVCEVDAFVWVKDWIIRIFLPSKSLSFTMLSRL